MSEQLQLSEIMGKANELWVWYTALQTAGFSDVMALGLLQTLVVSKEIKLRED
jgi:hypothetical protein